MSTLGLREHLTHRGNLRSSRYGWLRLTPMYSVHLVDELLGKDLSDGARVLDPFCGTGTTALVCAERGIACDTTDINPFLLWLTRAKAHPYTAVEIAAARKTALLVADAVRDSERGREWVPPLSNIEKWWEPPALDALSRAWGEVSRRAARIPTPSHWLLTIAFLRTAIRTAHVSFGHQSMSFRRNGNDATQLSIVRADRTAGPVVTEWEDAVDSITDAADSSIGTEPKAIYCDARKLSEALERRAYATVISGCQTSTLHWSKRLNARLIGRAITSSPATESRRSCLRHETPPGRISARHSTPRGARPRRPCAACERPA